ncbi:MAG: arylsulfatase [Flavobacteriaceae bacterium]|jgi:arylsulfatase A
MTFKKFYLINILVFFLFFSCLPKKELQDQYPNIIYILADDLGYGDLSTFNPASKIKTPHLDQMAREGMRFLDMHSTSSVCTPTRYSILTGEYAWRTRLKSGVLWSYGPSMIPDQKETVAKLLQRNNYQTGVVGKWHLGLDWQLKPPYQESQIIKNELGLITDYKEEIIDFSKNPTKGPKEIGFDYSFILPASLDIPPYVYLENGKFTQKINSFTDGSNLEGDKDYDFWRPGPMAEAFDFFKVLPTFMDKAKVFIEKTQEKEAPFFLYLPLAAPHTPWVPETTHQGQSKVGMYGDFVEMIDEQIGQLMTYLDTLGISEETLVIFTSDNGPYWKPHHIEEFDHRAAANFRGMKGDIYEAGHRVPFVVKWPGTVSPGSTSDQINSLANFYATIADLLDVPSNALDSHSLFDELIGKEANTYSKPIIHHSSRGHFALRDGDWKMIEKRGSGGFTAPATESTPEGESQERLFNLIEDPSEKNNLSQTFPLQLERMKQKLDSIRKLK